MSEETASVLRFLVEGSRACFRQSGFALDLISQDVLPPLTARRILARAFGARSDWRINSITVLNRPTFEWLKLTTERGVVRVLALTNVRYSIEASACLEACGDYVGQTASITLGLREFEGTIEIIEKSEHRDPNWAFGCDMDLGWLPHDIVHKRTRYVRHRMADGIITIDNDQHLAGFAY